MTDSNDDDAGARKRSGPPRTPRSGPRDDRGGGPRRNFKSPRGERDGPRGEGAERPKRSFGEKRGFGDKPRFGDKPKFGEKRSFGDKPRFGGKLGGERPFRARTQDTRSEHRPRVEEAPRPAEPVEDRIAKVIARAGIASRRDAEAMIEAGRVTLNGEVLTSPAINVTAADAITVDGEPLPARERTRLWIFHKPRGLVTTARDPEGRPTVFEALPEEMPRVVTIGRLDINTEGLLLLTNDGGLAKVIAHPETGWLRRYKVRAYGETNQPELDKLRNGLVVEGIEYGPIEASLDRMQGDNVWLTLGLREGKNREVKNILDHLGLRVNRLIRLSFGPFQLGDLEPGMVEEVRTKVLKDQLGHTLAEQAGVDFVSPVREPLDRPRPAREERARPARDYGDRPARDYGDRPAREHGDRPQRDRGERFERPERGSFRGRDEDAAPRGKAGEGTKSERPKHERSAPVWRAEDVAKPEKRTFKRNKLAPDEARAAAAERPRQRVGRIAREDGSSVVVERLTSQAPKEEPREARPPREEERPRRAFREDERPARRPREDRVGSPRARAPRGDGPPRARPPREDGERSFRGPRREEGDRPFRKGPPRDGGGPRRFGEDRPDRPRGERARGERPQGERSGSERAGGERPPGRGAGKPSFGKTSFGKPSFGKGPRRDGPGGGAGRSGPPRSGPPRSGPRPPRSGPRERS